MEIYFRSFRISNDVGGTEGLETDMKCQILNEFGTSTPFKEKFPDYLTDLH